MSSDPIAGLFSEFVGMSRKCHEETFAILLEIRRQPFTPHRRAYRAHFVFFEDRVLFVDFNER
jgi:hypothetical protein